MLKIEVKNLFPGQKHIWSGLFMIMVFVGSKIQAQSVGYYPWNGLLSVSTNPYRPMWLDFRLQTNTLFGSLSTEVLPMVNLKQKESFQLYLGGGVRFNFIGVLANQTNNLVEGYQLNIGTRVAPFKSIPQVRVGFELAPYVQRKLDSGILKSNFGVIYTFGQK